MFISFGFVVWVETQKGRKRCASGPSAGWLLLVLVVWLLPLLILEILLAAFTAPERLSRVQGIGTDDVDVGSLHHIFPRCDISTVTAGKAHQGRHATLSKDGRHGIATFSIL